MKSKTVSGAKKKAWEWFSKYIRLRDAIKTTGTKTTLHCFTCGKPYPAFGVGCAQAGHFIPGRTNAVLIDEQGVHGQCYNCNQNLNGNWVEYERKMLLVYGQEVVDRLKQAKGQIRKMAAWEWDEIAERYKAKFKELENQE